ncbi:MAG: hypothetical protein ACOH1Y_00205 [Propionicimonas sp.]
MSTMYGADVAQLRALAAQLERHADELDRGRMTVGNAIRISAWVGPFAATFRLQWDSEHSQSIMNAVGRLRESARLARGNADAQERASAVDGSGPANASVPCMPHLTPEREADYERLLAALKMGSLTAGTLDDLKDLLAGLEKGSLEYKSFTEWLTKVKGLDAGTILGLVGMGITAKELGEALGENDPAAILDSSLDLAMGAVGLRVPGAGLAYEFGKMMGETGYTTLQQVYDSPGSALDFAARSIWGPDASWENIDQDQRDILMTRYEGMPGILITIGDSVGGAWDDFWRWATTGHARGPRR